MFKDAYALAINFTFPVILSRRNVSGACSSGIGTFVVINDEGWIVTAGHILEQWEKMCADVASVREHEARRAAIDADSSLDHKERRKKLQQLGKFDKSHSDQCSAFWGGLPGQLAFHTRLNWIDIGVGKLEPFDPATMKGYPVFKDPRKNFEPGVSLCKLGFPFHSIEPSYDMVAKRFLLPTGALPVPFFPIEGMFTRTVGVVVPNAPPPPCPMLWVETSTPGLRGQSGGPTFDSKGTIWAIQCQTSSLQLGFDDSISPQYYHVGLGAHPTTMFHLFDEMKIKYVVSDY